MRNGITPVMPLRAAGVNIAMGLDDKTINDDEDAVMELRMMHKVHRLHTFDLATPALSAYEALEIGTLNGAKASGFAGEVGIDERTRRRRPAQSEIRRQCRLAAPQCHSLQPALGLQARRPTRGISHRQPKRLRFLLLNTVGKVVRHAREILLRCTKEIARALAGPPRTCFALKRPR